MSNIFYHITYSKNLPAILKNGILPMSKTGVNDWENNNRAANSQDVVYLYQPCSQFNFFHNYGDVLIEVEKSNDVQKSQVLPSDSNAGKYIEFTTDYVSPSEIKTVYIPSILADKIDVPAEYQNKIHYCKLSATVYDKNGVLKLYDDSSDVIQQWAKTVILKPFNHFRGINPDYTVIDLINVIYHI